MGDLYRLRSASGELLYIGISYSAIARFAQHRESQPWIDDVASIEITHVDATRSELAEIERAAIRSEHPRHNVVHNRSRVSALPETPAAVAFDCLASFGDVDLHRQLTLALDAAAHAHAARLPEGTFGQFCESIAALLRAARHADCCDRCDWDKLPHYPYREVRRDDGATTAYYHCPEHGQWTCWWGASE